MFEESYVAISDLEKFFFMGGDIIIAKISNSNSEVIFSNDFKLNKSKIVKYLSKTETIHNEFFKDKNIKNYFIFLLHNDSDYDISGANINNFQTIILGKKVKLDYDLQRTISHENLHKWFNDYRFGEAYNLQGNNCWFIEGFTDYYTDYLNYKNGLLSFSQYINIYNMVLQEYYTSPFQLLTNREIGMNPYDNEIFRLAYLRGRIIAHELNYLIQEYTGGQKNLDEYIKYLFEFKKNNLNTNFTPNFLWQTLFDFTGSDFSEFIKCNIIQNNIIVKAKYIIASDFHQRAFLRLDEFQRRVYDFNFLDSQLNWIISGVKGDTKAFRAGLRNGQKILSITTKDDNSIFEVEKNNVISKIRLEQEYEKTYVPQYRTK